jgi:hypothetical protein
MCNVVVHTWVLKCEYGRSKEEQDKDLGDQLFGMASGVTSG